MSPSQPIIERFRNSRQKPEGMHRSRDHRGTSLTSLLSAACSACSLTHPRSTCPGMTRSTVSRVPLPPTSVINHESPMDLPPGQSDGGNSSNDVPSSKMALACVKWTKRNKSHPTVPTHCQLIKVSKTVKDTVCVYTTGRNECLKG